MIGFVKICGLSTPETLAAALDAGAEFVGFVFFVKSPRNVSVATARELAARVEGRATIVALSVDAGDAALGAMLEATGARIAQLHGRETPERVAEVHRRFGVEVMKAVGVADAADLARAADYFDVADRILLDAKPPKDALLPGGNGLPFDWRLARDFRSPRPWLLSGGLAPHNVAAAIAATGAPGVDVSSGVETAPGVKDVGKIKEFVAEAKLAFAEVSGMRT